MQQEFGHEDGIGVLGAAAMGNLLGAKPLKLRVGYGFREEIGRASRFAKIH